MFTRLTLITAPEGTPISVAEAKARLRVVDDTSEDNDIQIMIDDAVARIDGPRGIGVCMEQQTWQLSLDCFPRVIDLPLHPVVSVDSITYIDTNGDEQTLAESEYEVDVTTNPARIQPAYDKTWPSTRSMLSPIKIQFVAGHSETPSDLKNALLMTVAHIFENREAVSGVQMYEVPQSVTAILDRYRVVGAG